MYLWNPGMLQELPTQLLTALHRDVCRVRSARWRKARGRSGWVYMLPWGALVWYHKQVLKEMKRRGWGPSPAWFDDAHRGRSRAVPELVANAAENTTAREQAAQFKAHNPNDLAADATRLEKWRARHGRQ